MQEIERQTGKFIRDVIVVGGMLAVLNLWMARSDFGWIKLNPTPWILLPILIGSRYGLTPGVVSGLLSGLAITLVQARAAGVPEPAFAQQHSFFFTSLVLGGFLAGEMNRLHRARTRALLESNTHLEDQSARLGAELELARETRQELQHHLALLNAPLASLDEDLRKVITEPPAQLQDRLLAVLHQHTRISSAAIYKTEGENLQRLSALQPSRPLAEVLRLEETPLAAQSLQEQAIASVPDPLQTTAAQPFLAAIPWTDATGSGILLVQDMPLQAYNWANLAKIQLIASWAFSLSRLRSDLHEPNGQLKLLPQDEFLLQVDRLLAAEQTHHLPSVIVRADFAQASDAANGKASRVLLQAVPPTALCTQLSNHGSLMMLLPFAGEPEARALGQILSGAGPEVRLSHYLVVGPVTLNDFWAHVMLP